MSHSWSSDLEASHPFGESCEKGAQLEPGEARSGAVVEPATEGEVVDRVACHVEAVRVVEPSLVAVSGTDQHDDSAVGGDGDAADFDVVVGDSCIALDGGVIAEYLVDRRRDEVGVAADLVPLIRVLGEQVERCADRVHRGVHARLEVGEHDTVDRLRFEVTAIDGVVDAGPPAAGFEVLGNRDRVGVVDQALIADRSCLSPRSGRPPGVEAQPCPRQEPLAALVRQSDEVTHDRHAERHRQLADHLHVATIDCLVAYSVARDSMNSSWGLSAAGRSWLLSTRRRAVWTGGSEAITPRPPRALMSGDMPTPFAEVNDSHSWSTSRISAYRVTA